jgi:hypothetical protein
MLGAFPSTSSAIAPIPTSAVHLYTTPSKAVMGLVGSYVNQSLEAYAPQDDWRVTQTIVGSRVDPTIDFATGTWGARAPLNLTGGSDADWDNFSVQWDGYIDVTDPAARFLISSDDGSRMWIDVNHDGAFASSGDEFVDNGWGRPHAIEASPPTIALAAGLYKIRIQYVEDLFGNYMTLAGVPRPTVRFAYVIPVDRSAQPIGIYVIRQMILEAHAWYADQMDRFGMGARSFHFETESDGVTPRVNVVHVTDTAESLRVDLWGRAGAAAQAAGVPLWSNGEVWVVFPEAFVQTANSAILGGIALGGGYGNGDAPGVAMLGADKLAIAYPNGIVDNRDYNGLVFPGVGPLALVYQTTFPGFEGSTVSSVISSYVGAMAHEMTHGFGAPHDFRNDDNFLGNLMGNGLRGIRGSLFPGNYPLEYTQLTYGLAGALAVNRFFEPTPFTPAAIVASDPMTSAGSPVASAVLPPDEPLAASAPPKPRLLGDFPAPPQLPSASLATQGTPSVSLLTSGTVSPIAGLLPIHFQATGTTALREAWLIRDGNLVEDMPLASTTVDATIHTTWYDAGGTSTYEVHVYDADGNRASASGAVTAAAGGNHAPVPLVHVTPSDPHVGATVTLDASGSSDPDGAAASLKVEWDVDGDNVFDTAPTTAKTLAKVYSTPGARLIRARITDPSGAQAVSAPVAIRVLSLPLDVPGGRARPGLALAARPEPLVPGGRLVYALPAAGIVSLEVFDVQGRLESRLLHGRARPAGVQELAWPASDMNGRAWRPGVHFCRLASGGREIVRRVVLVR